jgi:pyridoxal phosphate enzyme (YggS family)
MNGSMLAQRWQALHDEMEQGGVTMLAVSKYHSDEDVAALAALGQRDFGESRPQALRDRAQKFPELNWHMIGPVQKNKAKYVGRYAAMWHSLSDIEVARAVAAHVENRELPVLLQINISGEGQKQGVAPQAARDLLEQVKAIDGLKVIGLMGMAAKFVAGDEGSVRDSFRMLRNLQDQLGDANLRQLCMGMSGDFRIAIEEGATMVRLGTVLFEPEQFESAHG